MEASHPKPIRCNVCKGHGSTHPEGERAYRCRSCDGLGRVAQCSGRYDNARCNEGADMSNSWPHLCTDCAREAAELPVVEEPVAAAPVPGCPHDDEDCVPWATCLACTLTSVVARNAHPRRSALHAAMYGVVLLGAAGAVGL